MGRLNWRYVLASVLCINVIYIYYVQNKSTFSDSSEVQNFTSTQLAKETQETNSDDKLICEKVWDNLLTLRHKDFTSQLNPAHVLIDDYLEIVSENKTICDINTTSNNNTNPVRLLVAIVNSARNHFIERQNIRDSWGSIKEYSGGWHVRTVFLVGQSDYCLSDRKNETMRNYSKDEDVKLLEEQEKHGDLVIGSVTDTYRNNTYMHLMGYKFVLERCPQAEFIVKLDDDTFVNVPMILNKRMVEVKEKKKIVNDIYCRKITKDGPKRCHKCKSAKWFATKEEWPEAKYPAYCPGWGIAMSTEWVKRIFSVRNMGGFYWIDDVFITGKLREIAEKEFGRKTNILAVNKQIWMGKPKKGICTNVTEGNIKQKQKQLAMYAHLNRNEMLGKFLKCLTDISLGRNLPFSV